MKAEGFRSRRNPRRHHLFLMGAVVAVLAAAGAGLALSGGPRARATGLQHRRQRIRVSGAAPAALRATPTRSAQASPPSSGHPRLPSVNLTGLSWRDFYGVELPVSPAAGPRHTRGGLVWGFADTPLGALLAAVNIGVRANAQWGPPIYGPTIRSQVTGQAAPALLAACEASYAESAGAAGVAGGQPLGQAHVTEEAFRWVSYTPAAATVAIVSEGPASGGVTVRAVTRVQVIWLRGDWRVVAPPGGNWGNSAAPLASLAGYTTFPLPAA